MNRSAADDSIRELARRVWLYRLGSELEAAQRFEALAPTLRELGVSDVIVAMAAKAASDELRHASLCRELIQHFGGVAPPEQQVSVRAIAPAGLHGRERMLYEVVALSCVTETLSTALLGALVTRARDSVCKQAMHSILRDEVNHSRLGWALLAEEHARGARDCVGEYLPQMFAATLGDEFFSPATAPDPRLAELAGLGSLERAERQQIVQETLVHVIFPGLERFGIETGAGRRWLRTI